MVSVSPVIMAHPRRSEFVDELLAKLDRPAPVVWDAGNNDRWDTGRRAWLAVDRSASHGLVLQDDAIIPRDLVAGVVEALAHVPDKTPMCLYTGRVRPHKHAITEAVTAASEATSWLTMQSLNWGVGIVIPTDMIEPMIAWGDGRPEIPNYDRRLSRWFGHQGIHTWYTWPSLVDHRDSPSLVPGRGSSGRRAHQFIGADASAVGLRWDGGVIHVNAPEPGIPKRPTQAPGQTKGEGPVWFVSDKYPDLSIPTIDVRFRNGRANVTRRGAVSYLRSPFMQRRGVRLATDAEATTFAGAAKPAADPPALVEVAEPAPHTAPDPTRSQPAPSTAGDVPDGTAADVIGWVGDDPDRARAAIAAENQREKPRSSLLAKLDRVGQE
jgi:hypothetical protein